MPGNTIKRLLIMSLVGGISGIIAAILVGWVLGYSNNPVSFIVLIIIGALIGFALAFLEKW